MIARIMGEGQWRLSDDLIAKLNELDDAAMEALEREDEAQLDQHLEEMAALVRSEGEQLPDDDLHPSDVIIPPTDLTLEETRLLFSEDGLVPDIPA